MAISIDHKDASAAWGAMVAALLETLLSKEVITRDEAREVCAEAQKAALALPTNTPGRIEAAQYAGSMYERFKG